MGHGRSTGTSTAWFPVARTTDVGTTPVPVGAGGQAYVVVRLRPGGEVSAFPARCPHRLVPLAAGTVVDGTAAVPVPRVAVRRGRATARTIPSLGADGTSRRRGPTWPCRGRSRSGTAGCGWRPSRTADPVPPRAAVDPARARAGPAGAGGPGVRQPRPVARARLAPGGPLHASCAAAAGCRSGCSAAPGCCAGTATGVVRRAAGLRRPRAARADLAGARPSRPTSRWRCPRHGDRRFVAGWLPPVRSPGPGRSAGRQLPRRDALPVRARGDVRRRRRDRGAAPTTSTRRAGRLHQRRRSSGATTRTTRRSPPGAGRCASAGGPRTSTGRRSSSGCGWSSSTPARSTTILFLLQPEDADSTRIYTCLLLSAGPGQPLPAPATSPRRWRSSRRCWPRTSTCRRTLRSTGLPLVLRDELHVRADRLGVALRRALTDFARRRPPAGRRPA